MLDLYDDHAWSRALTALLPALHPVDRNATEIWFAFFPLRLARALAQAADPEELARKLQLRGTYSLKDQIDTSHRFLYGHRWWPQVKRAVAARAAAGRTLPDLETEIRSVAAQVALQTRVPEPLLLGITAVAFLTLQQVGLEALQAAPGRVLLEPAARAKSPEKILAARARDDRQRWLRAMLRGDVRKSWSITWDENDPAARFVLIDTQHLTTAAANDPRPHHLCEPRCKAGEGPIPIECRAAACGTCWVGVLGGADKLSEVQPLERRRIREFGYIDTAEPRPLIRLACMAQAFGAVSLVIPPWNGYFANYLDPEHSGLSAIARSGKAER